MKTVKQIAEELGKHATYTAKVVKEIGLPVEGYTHALRGGKVTAMPVACYPDDSADRIRCIMAERIKARNERGGATRHRRHAEAKAIQAQGPIITPDGTDRILQAGIRDQEELIAYLDKIDKRLDDLSAQFAALVKAFE